MGSVALLGSDGHRGRGRDRAGAPTHTSTMLVPACRSLPGVITVGTSVAGVRGCGPYPTGSAVGTDGSRFLPQRLLVHRIR